MASENSPASLSLSSWDDFNPSECKLCPRVCGADRAHGQRGMCGAAADVLVARAALHFWEEPPISGDSGSGTIFFSHCSLRCCYCQNADISQGLVGSSMSAASLVEMCLDLQDQGALNINFVTPTHYAPHVRETVRRARNQGLALPIVWNTGGYELVSVIRDNADTVDVYLTDFKYSDAQLAKRYSHVDDYPQRALEALDAMVDCVSSAKFDTFHGQTRMIRGIIVRHMLLPEHLDDSKQVVRLLRERYGNSIRLSLMNQYTPVLLSRAQAGDDHVACELKRYPELASGVAQKDYEELLDFADSIGIEDYFWQQGDTCLESFIPEFSSDL